MLDSIPTQNIRNYLMCQDKDTLVELITNAMAKQELTSSDALVEIQSLKDDLEQLKGDYDELERERDDLRDKLEEVEQVDDAIAVLWDDAEFNALTEKAITQARSFKFKDNSPIGELLRKLSYKVTIE